ncbi:MAG: metal-dependent hydrolase [Croceibacterium sp.]
MDNLTHSLIGAVIGQAGLKRKTGLAMPALVIGANIPDIDATCVIYGTQSLAMRRGLTHGPIAWVLLPLVLAGLLYGWDRWQAGRGKRPPGRRPVRFGWLYLLSLIACLTHPAMDWMNNYGVRLLEPFSHRWFYGDVLFIIDVWLWLGLGFATWLSLRREKQAGGNWQGPARIALVAGLVYIGANAGLTTLAERQALTREPYPHIAIANEVPVLFWRRELVTGNGDGIWQIGGERRGDVPLAACDLAGASRDNPDVRAFLFWSRAPFVARSADGWVLGDARYAGLASRNFNVALPRETCRG